MNFNDVQQSVWDNRRKVWQVLPLGLLVLGGCASSDTAYNKTTDGGYHARGNSPGYKALQDGDYVYAAQYFDAANRETPGNPYFELNLAAAYQREGRMTEAEPLLRQAMLNGGSEDPVGWTTELAKNHTVAETACQNLDMGLATAPTAATATECQRFRLAALTTTTTTPVYSTNANYNDQADDVPNPIVPNAVQPAQQIAAVTPAPVVQPPYVRGITRGNIYFDFDKSSLTGNGGDLVNSLAAEMRANPSIQVVLLGKADHPGTDLYNMELSDRRATTVRNALIAAGISGNRVSSRYVGEREAPVVTAEATHEQLNRVVELTIN